MIGCAYLCFEGAEKLAHKFFHFDKNHDKAEAEHEVKINAAVKDANIDLVQLEKEKIKGAIRTDFVLSAEIIVIALGTVAGKTFADQALVVSLIALIMTIGVYGLVAGIVKLDDFGLHLMLKKGTSLVHQLQRKIGNRLLAFAPILMRFLSVAGTAAMFMVGGSIIGHGLAFLHHFSELLVQRLSQINGVLAAVAPLVLDAIVGLIVGAICVIAFEIIKKLRQKNIKIR